MATKEATSANMSDVRECLCRNGIVGRGHEVNAKRPHGFLFFLFCMMCGRRSEGDTPAATVIKWNSENADRPNN